MAAYGENHLSESLSLQPGTKSMELLHLNDDCLIRIFSYLDNFQLIEALGTCQRLDEIVHINLRRCKDLSISLRLFTDEKYEKLLWTISPYLNSLELSAGYSMRPELVLKALHPISQCTQLKRLSIHYILMCKEYMELITCISDSLEAIDLSFCLLEDELMAKFFLSHCGSLKELSIVGNYCLEGRCLVHLRNMKKITLEEHEEFSVDIDELKANNPCAKILIYEKGRFSEPRLV